MEETVRYTFRLRPGLQAERALLDEWHRCRFLWNEAVHQERSGQKPTRAKLCKVLTEARRVNAWLRDGWQNAQANVLCLYAAELDRSFKVKGRRRPTVKKKDRALPSLELNRNGFSINTDGRLVLPKGTTIPVVWSRDLPSDPTSVRVYRDSLGHWYASFVVRRDTERSPDTDGSVGFDWGVTTTATASDERYDLPYGGHRKRCAAELAKAQRRMSRRHKRGKAPSNGYKRARRDAAKLHKKAQRQNTHAARVWAKRVVAENQLIAVENLRLVFLGKTTMARKAADGAIGVARRELIERAGRAGRQVVMVEPAYTTMTCSRCDSRAKTRLPLSERTFRCDSCGYTDTRDRNAARVILARAERGPAGADDVRHVLPPPEGVGVQSEPEISLL